MKTKLLVAIVFYALGVLTIVGCASFPWRFYNADMPSDCYDKGKLLGAEGKNGWPDISLTACKPDAAVKMKCATVPIDDFYSLKADDEKCHADLIACQKGPHP